MERIFLVFGLGGLLLISPMVGWWLRPELPWFLPYLVWLLIIALIPWAHKRIDNR